MAGEEDRTGDQDGQKEGKQEGQEGTEGDSKVSKGAESLLFELKQKDGTVKKLTLGEVQEKLARADEKERGADQKFRESAESRKEAEHYKRVVGDMAAAQKGDTAALKRLASYEELGVTQEAVDQALKAMETAGAQGGGQEEEAAPLDVEDFTPEMQKLFQDLKSQKDREIRTRIYSELDAYLDKDEVIGSIITNKRSPEPLVKRAREFAREVLLRRAAEAQRRGDTSWAPGPAEFQHIAQNVRGWLDDVASIRGEAAVTGAVPSMGKSPGSHLASLHRSTEPPKRESSRKDGAYKESLRERLQYALEKGEGDNFGSEMSG